VTFSVNFSRVTFFPVTGDLSYEYPNLEPLAVVISVIMIFLGSAIIDMSIVG
jgi:hypothetical protein